MGKVIHSKTGREIEVPDGEPIRPACEEMGLFFSCTEGACGICEIKVEEGKDNLSELTEPEEDFEKDRENRLACQCKLKGGDIKIDFNEI
jgi:ferredoxin